MSPQQKIRTAVTDLLGIGNPVLLAGMFPVSSPKLAAAVSNAGGLGVIGGGTYSPDQLRKSLHELKSYLVDKNAPFGVDLLIPQVGGKARKTNYDYTHGKLDELIEIIIESGAKLFVCAIGIPPKRVVDRLHQGGVLYMNMVGHPHHAEKAIQNGADLLCAQGGEGGGHTGETPTIILIPAVSQVINGRKSVFTGKEIGLVAGGGLYNGQSLAASIMLGAGAVWVGTRFILCDEAGSSEMHRKAIVETGFDDIIRTTVFTGRPMNARATPYLRRWEGERLEEKLQLQAQGILPMGHDLDTKKDDEEVLDNAYPVIMGKVAALVKEKDRLPAKMIIDDMVDEAAVLLQRGSRMVKL
ncbi:hypothetical protein AJ79_05493 [Helicocarpus griseus UAMH5409]|uniref:Uncharacterized protein n=1 Tax=Helicocarpus griseus UAMH5409 TaxID=1447875 RepID=A0A2B7XNQ9_9EURO|nr:hypothetical protein AJ79_05493 [Helicocarpus griseus UAMH5409]